MEKLQVDEGRPANQVDRVLQSIKNNKLPIYLETVSGKLKWRIWDSTYFVLPPPFPLLKEDPGF